MSTAETIDSTDARVKGTAAVIDLIRSDPWVSRRDPLFRVPEDGATFDDPPPEDRLWIRLTPRHVSTRPVCSVGPRGIWAEVWMELAVEIQAPGYGWTTAAAVWEEIEAALGAGLANEPRIALMRYLRASGVLQWRTTSSPDAERADGQRKVTGAIQYRVVIRQ
jgi:hypothetical protein